MEDATTALIALALVFGAYLLLESARSDWRAKDLMTCYRERSNADRRQRGERRSGRVLVACLALSGTQVVEASQAYTTPDGVLSLSNSILIAMVCLGIACFAAGSAVGWLLTYLKGRKDIAVAFYQCLAGVDMASDLEHARTLIVDCFRARVRTSQPDDELLFDSELEYADEH